jgi:hypothetical protein
MNGWMAFMGGRTDRLTHAILIYIPSSIISVTITVQVETDCPVLHKSRVIRFP